MEGNRGSEPGQCRRVGTESDDYAEKSRHIFRVDRSGSPLGSVWRRRTRATPNGSAISRSATQNSPTRTASPTKQRKLATHLRQAEPSLESWWSNTLIRHNGSKTWLGLMHRLPSGVRLHQKRNRHGDGFTFRRQSPSTSNCLVAGPATPTAHFAFDEGAHPRKRSGANRFDRTAQFMQVLPRSRLGQNVFIFGRSLYPYLFLMGI
jgi:hypothetical protein